MTSTHASHLEAITMRLEHGQIFETRYPRDRSSRTPLIRPADKWPKENNERGGKACTERDKSR